MLSEDDLSRIKHLYLNDKLSSYQIAKITGIPVSTVGKELKKLGITRNHSEAAKIVVRRKRPPTSFICKSCGKRKPLTELVLDKRYSPPIYCCKLCAGY